MEEKFQRLIFIPITAVLLLTIGYQYVCPADSGSCSIRQERTGLLQRSTSSFQVVYTALEEDQEEEEEEEDPPLSFDTTPRWKFTQRDLDRHVDFNIRGEDVMVFLHIQKTGGTTFGRHLVKNIQLEQPCSCPPGQRRCTCHRPGNTESWLFSRFSTGWSCGLHADWTELSRCVPAVMDKRDRKSPARSRR